MEIFTGLIILRVSNGFCLYVLLDITSPNISAKKKILACSFYYYLLTAALYFIALGTNVAERNWRNSFYSSHYVVCCC